MAKLKIGRLMSLLALGINQFTRDDPPFEHPLEQTKEFLSGEGSLPELFEELRERPVAPEFNEESNREFREASEARPSFTQGVPNRDLVAELNEESRKFDAKLLAENPDSFVLGSRDMADAQLAEFRSWTRNGIFDSSRINSRPVDSHR